MSKKISQLASATSLAQNDLFEVVNIDDKTMSTGGTNKKITTSLLAEQLSFYINDDKRWLKFPNQTNWGGAESNFVTSVFLSRDRRLYGSGYANGQRFGKGGYQYNTINNGFRDVTPRLLEGEYIEEIYTCRYSFFVLTNKKNLYSTGYNGYGQLGRNGTTDDPFWGKINLSNVTWFSPRNSNTQYVHCLAISNNQLYSWGYNGYGQLGNGNTTNRTIPTLVDSGSIAGLALTKAFACGDDAEPKSHSFVIDSDRNLHFVGQNAYGHGGTGDTASRANFVKIGGGVKADHVTSRTWYGAGTTFILDGKTLYACGYNGEGQLGVNSVIDRPTFGLTTPALTTVEQIVASNYYNSSIIVRLTNGTIRTWGRNGYGQCGNGNTTDIKTPYNPGLSNIVKVFAVGGEEFITSYALTEDGECYAAGYNGYGQCGDGTDNNNYEFKLMLKDSNHTQFKDIAGWSDGNNGNGVNLVDQRGDLHAVGYTNWGAGGHFQYGENWCYVPERAEVK